MKPLCLIVLFTVPLICRAEEKPALEREGEKLPIVKMPLGKLPFPMNAPEPPLLKKGYPPGTEVAVEGQFEMDDKDFEPFRIQVIFRVKDPKRGWVIAGTHVGGNPVKVKAGLYHLVELPTFRSSSRWQSGKSQSGLVPLSKRHKDAAENSYLLCRGLQAPQRPRFDLHGKGGCG